MKEFFVSRAVLKSKGIHFSDDQVVAIVGPNSSGKSALLSSMYGRLTADSQYVRASQVSELAVTRLSDTKEFKDHIENIFTYKDRTIYWFGNAIGISDSYEATVAMWLQPRGLLHHMNKSLADYISARDRLQSVAHVHQLDLLRDQPSHPFHLLYKFPDKENRLSEVSRKIFGVDVMLNPGAGSVLALHVGEKIDAASYGGDRDQRYANEVFKLPEIETQGDGVQATIGLLARVLVSPAVCIFVDEPDLYLHPPQATTLAMALTAATTGKQLFISTHSARFLQGLFSAAPERLKLIRLFKEGQSFDNAEVDEDIFLEVKKDPVLRFTNILDALFFDVSVVCEDPSDCLFFKSSLERLGHGELIENTFWTGAYGKSNLPKLARICRAMRVKTIVICDIDVLSPEGNSHINVLKPLLEAFGETPDDIISQVEKLHRMVAGNARVTWRTIKDLGLRALETDSASHAAAQKILSDLLDFGIIVIPFGEVESLCSPQKEGHGIQAINAMLDMDIDDPALSNARRLCGTIIGCLQASGNEE